MPASFASPEWIDLVWAEMRADESTRMAAAPWVYGPIGLIVEAEGEQFPSATGIWLEVHEGDVRQMAAVDPARARQAPFVLAGPFGRWKQLLTSDGADIVDAVLQGSLRFAGDLTAIARHREFLGALLASCVRAETTWPEAPQPAGAR